MTSSYKDYEVKADTISQVKTLIGYCEYLEELIDAKDKQIAKLKSHIAELEKL